MSSTYAKFPSFCSQKSIISPPKAPKTQGEIIKEKTRQDANIAKEKPANERTVGDYLTIGIDTINKTVENIPVVHANSPQKLNYLA